MGRLTTLYHIDRTEHGIVDVVEYLHPALVGNAGEVGTTPVVILNSSLAQLKRKKNNLVIGIVSIVSIVRYCRSEI